MLHVDVLYDIKRKKYKTVCAELAFAKSPSTEWSWILYRTYNSFSLIAKSIALEASTLTITLPMRFPIFILFLFFF
jgi:hypothetical protein